MKNPYLIEVRELIRGVAERWHGLRIKDRIALIRDVEIWEKLKALNTETCTAAEAQAIIGSEWWVRVKCTQCDRLVDAVVVVGEEENDLNPDTATAHLCRVCLEKAWRMISEQRP